MTEERKDPAPKGPGVMATTVHDPLCPCNESGHTHYEYAPSGLCTYCRCDLIEKVREDVVNRFVGFAQVHWDAGYAFGVNDGQRDMLAKCIAAVHSTITSAPTLGQKRALAALQALSATADSGTNVSSCK